MSDQVELANENYAKYAQNNEEIDYVIHNLHDDIHDGRHSIDEFQEVPKFKRYDGNSNNFYGSESLHRVFEFVLLNGLLRFTRVQINENLTNGDDIHSEKGDVDPAVKPLEESKFHLFEYVNVVQQLDYLQDYVQNCQDLYN